MKRLFTVMIGMSALCVLAFLLSACGDNENVNKKQEATIPEVIVPSAKDRQPFVVTNLLGELTYDEQQKEWIIFLKREQPGMFIQLGDEEGAYMVVSNMKKDYEKYVGPVSFSGEAAMKHKLVYDVDLGKVTYVYTVNLINFFSTGGDNK